MAQLAGLKWDELDLTVRRAVTWALSAQGDHVSSRGLLVGLLLADPGGPPDTLLAHFDVRRRGADRRAGHMGPGAADRRHAPAGAGSARRAAVVLRERERDPRPGGRPAQRDERRAGRRRLRVRRAAADPGLRRPPRARRRAGRGGARSREPPLPRLAARSGRRRLRRRARARLPARTRIPPEGHEAGPRPVRPAPTVAVSRRGAPPRCVRRRPRARARHRAGLRGTRRDARHRGRLGCGGRRAGAPSRRRQRARIPGPRGGRRARLARAHPAAAVRDRARPGARAARAGMQRRDDRR